MTRKKAFFKVGPKIVSFKNIHNFDSIIMKLGQYYLLHRSPERKFTQGKNKKMDSKKSKGKFRYLWVGKVLGATKKLGSWELFGRFWPKNVQNWTKWAKSISAALRVTQDHSFTRFKALSVNLTLKVHFLSLEGKI